MLKSLSQIITVAKVEIAIQIDICEHSQVSLFQWMRLLDGRFAHAYHYSVFDCIDQMFSNHGAFCTLGYQNHVVTFHEANEAEHTVRADFLHGYT